MRVNINRRKFLQMGSGSVAAMFLPTVSLAVADIPEALRPNILWVSCEDISPDLGCYGEKYSETNRAIAGGD